MSLAHVDMRKWPDWLHWQFDARLLGEDEYGMWLHAPSDTIVKRGSEPSQPLGIGFVGLVPRDEWWIVEFYTDHPWHSVYVNIGTPPVWDGDRVTQIDLDLDVVRTLDDIVVVLDEDEFAEHQIQYSYPPHIIASPSFTAIPKPDWTQYVTVTAFDVAGQTVTSTEVLIDGGTCSAHGLSPMNNPELPPPVDETRRAMFSDAGACDCFGLAGLATEDGMYFGVSRDALAAELRAMD